GNLDGVMIGRATFGNPWIMKDVCEALRSPKSNVKRLVSRVVRRWTLDDSSKFIPTIEQLSFEEKIPLIIEHCELAVKLKGERRGMLEMRKHLASYVKGIDGAKELRARLVRVETFNDVKNILM
ncbi:tRNA-dihydrouridine synthase, partial [Patescibacteria group bacterium]|nr:tRNA-dihydrouridine synthase [Patescibacteria group bacterium]